MRLSKDQIAIIQEDTCSIFGEGVNVLLFGSRLDDVQRGEDIDLLVECHKPIQDCLHMNIQMPIIEVKNLTKEYQLGSIVSLKQSAVSVFNKLTGRPVVQRERFKALDDINFTVEEGEVVGIIGTNGAGKSTLLKHLANITKPTKGEVIVRGSIAPLIEVSAGVNPELTGRENIFLNGAILGIPKKVINQKLDGIVEFSELDQFIDTPVKRYSTGMKVRLGFSIATSMDADVLIIDEVLAVGDLAFQRKCFDRMEEVIKGRGSTVLLVSHNIRQIERMCSRVILLDHGRIETDAAPSAVCALFYDRSNAKVRAMQGVSKKARITTAGEFDLISIDVLDQSGVRTQSLVSGDPLRVRIRFRLKNDLRNPEIIVGTHTTDFVYLTASSTALFPDRPDYAAGMHEVEYVAEALPLAAGVYCIRLCVFGEKGRKLFSGEMLETFSVTEAFNIHESNWRTLNIPASWVLGKRRYFEKPEQNEMARTCLQSKAVVGREQ